MKISIITPSKNQAEFIERTIQSVISQDCGIHELEYIIMDGNSSDNTLNILNRYTKNLIWKSEKDEGQTHAINKGIQLATGDIIGWLNSDDIYYPNTFKKICHFFEKHPDIDVVYGDAYFIDRHDEKIGFYPTEKWNINRLKLHCFISQPSTFFRRKLILNHGLLNEKLNFCMDYEYWLRLGLARVHFFYLEQILSATRLYQETKSSLYCSEAVTETIRMIQKKLNYIPLEWFIRQTNATVKSKYDIEFRHSKLMFILLIWLNLWKTIGEYSQGFMKFLIFLFVQFAMIKEGIWRYVTLLKKKWKYS